MALSRTIGHNFELDSDSSSAGGTEVVLLNVVLLLPRSLQPAECRDLAELHYPQPSATRPVAFEGPAMPISSLDHTGYLGFSR